MDTIDKIIAFEEGELSLDEIIELFTDLYKTGQLNHLQGMYGRTFANLVEEGFIDLKALQTENKI